MVPLRANLDSLLSGLVEINGLKLAEQPRIYNNQDLYVMINGGAETYLEYGFNRALNVSYLFNNTKRIEIQLYEMTDDGAAFGIFSSSRNEGDSSVTIGDFASGNDYYIMNQKSRFYYVVSADENLPEVKNAVKKIAVRIADNIAGKGSLPELVKKALTAGYNIEQIKYIKGKIALSGNYFFTHKDVFKTRDAVCIDDGENKLFIFQYPDNLTAASQLTAVKDELTSIGRYTNFTNDENKFNCLDKNSKQIKIRVSEKYVLVGIGNTIDDKKLFDIASN